MTRRPRAGRTDRLLIIVQNLPVPFDRRVWLEAQALTRAGYRVSVVCPRRNGLQPYQVIDGVEVFAFPSYAPGGSAAGFVLEYAQSFLAVSQKVLSARRRGRFAAMQACNPPDIFWPLAAVLRWVDGTRFVFDHHDLCPELYESRFEQGSRLAHRGLLFLERMTFRTADRVTSTNESYAQVAVERGDVDRDRVTVVRTGPDPSRLVRGQAQPELKRGRRYLAAYIGVMGPQDGVDVVLAAADHIVNRLGRTDIAFTLMGAGDSFDSLVAERDRLGLNGHVEFLGRVPDETVTAVLSTADIGLSPDPRNPLNDVSTMNKTMEYMAFSLPVVAFDLRETKVSAADAAVYAEPNSPQAYAEAILELAQDEPRRLEMGRRGRQRVEEVLAWSRQEPAYVGVYQELVGSPAGAPATPRAGTDAPRGG